MKAPPIEAKELVRISSMMTMGLRCGRDWIAILSWIALTDSKPKIRSYLSSWTKRLKLDSAENILREERLKSKDLLWRLFIEILLQANRGGLQLSRLFENFADVGRAVHQLKQKEKSLLFIPKFQSWASLLLTLGFTAGLPLMAPGFFPTFLTQGRDEYFFVGVSFVAIGFVILHWICSQPQRKLSPKLGHTFFLYLLSVHLESGLDFVTSWVRAGESVDFDPKMRTKLFKPGLNVDTIDSFLTELSAQLKTPWSEVLTGILWAKTSGSNLSQYLKQASNQETQELLFHWEDEIRKLTMISLIPLGFLIFPGTLFLLVGPQFMELVSTL